MFELLFALWEHSSRSAYWRDVSEIRELKYNHLLQHTVILKKLKQSRMEAL